MLSEATPSTSGLGAITRYRTRALSRAAALAPLWTLVWATFLGPGYFTAVTATPPDFLGISFGTVINSVALLWMSIGAAVVWNAGSQATELLGHLLFTTPASVAVVFSPSLVFVITNVLVSSP